MIGRVATGKIGSLKDLEEELNTDSRGTVGMILGDSERYSRYLKDLDGLGELQAALNNAGFNAFLLFFEDHPESIELCNSEVDLGYNIKYADIKSLDQIDVFLVVDIPEVVNQLDFPNRSKVVVLAHNLRTVAVSGDVQQKSYWAASVLHSVADYMFYPSANLKDVFTEEFTNNVIGNYSSTLGREFGRLSLIPGGSFNLDSRRKLIKENSTNEKCILIAPTASWHNANKPYLGSLINKLATSLPELKIIVRPYPGDNETFDLVENILSGENIEVDRGDSFAGAACRSLLLISDKMSSIKTSYAFACCKPVIEYDIANTDKINECELGYAVGTLDNLVSIVTRIATDISEQERWSDLLLEKAEATIANYGTSIDRFVEAVPRIMRGATRPDWVTLAKKVEDCVQDEQTLSHDIEAVYSCWKTPYAIIYSYKMIREGLRVYPNSPVMHYFAGRAMEFPNAHAGFELSADRGYYYAFIVKDYPEFFEQITLEFAELELLFMYLIKNDSGLEDDVVDKLLAVVLKKIVAMPNGNQIIITMFQVERWVEDTVVNRMSATEKKLVTEISTKCGVKSSDNSILSCFDLIASGLEQFPDNSALNYFAGKYRQIAGDDKVLGHGESEGYYYDKILDNDIGFFQSVNWKIKDFVQLFKYRLTK